MKKTIMLALLAGMVAILSSCGGDISKVKYDAILAGVPNFGFESSVDGWAKDDWAQNPDNGNYVDNDGASVVRSTEHASEGSVGSLKFTKSDLNKTVGVKGGNVIDFTGKTKITMDVWVAAASSVTMSSHGATWEGGAKYKTSAPVALVAGSNNISFNVADIVFEVPAGKANSMFLNLDSGSTEIFIDSVRLK